MEQAPRHSHAQWASRLGGGKKKPSASPCRRWRNCWVVPRAVRVGEAWVMVVPSAEVYVVVVVVSYVRQACAIDGHGQETTETSTNVSCRRERHKARLRKA